MKRYTLVVTCNALEGHEAEFNDRLDNVHLQEMLAIDGVVSAQRLRLALTQHQPEQMPVHRYAVLYEIETDDIEAFHERLMANRADRSPAEFTDHRDNTARYFEQLSDPIKADAL